MLLMKVGLLAAVSFVAANDPFAHDILQFVLNEYKGASLASQGGDAGVFAPNVPHINNASALELLSSGTARTLQRMPSDQLVRQADFRVETGLFLDVNEDHWDDDSEDDCQESKWAKFWPFSEEKPDGTRQKVQIPTQELLQPAYESSHGLFSSGPKTSNRTKFNYSAYKAAVYPQKESPRMLESHLNRSVAQTRPRTSEVANTTLSQSHAPIANETIGELDIEESSATRLTVHILMGTLLLFLGFI